MHSCEECSAKNRDEAKFCGGCGFLMKIAAIVFIVLGVILFSLLPGAALPAALAAVLLLALI